MVGFGGTWLTETFDEQGNIVTTNDTTLFQSGDDLHGYIVRTSPKEQTHRQYDFIGHLRGETMLGMFWATNITVKSYGSWYVKHANDRCYEGLYLKNDGEKVISIKLRLTKVD